MKKNAQVKVNEAEMLGIAAQRSVDKPEDIHWLQVAWDGEGRRRRAVQWVGYVQGNRVAAITWVRKFGKRPAGYMTMTMRRPVGIFKQLADAQDEAGMALSDVGEAVVELFTAMAKHGAEWREYSEMLYGEVGQGIWALGQWASAAYEEHVKESQAAIAAAKAQIEAFNALHCVKHKKAS